MKNRQISISDENLALLDTVGNGKMGETPNDVLERVLKDYMELRTSVKLHDKGRL
jgi:hypothetical protein